MKKFQPRDGYTVLAHKVALDPNATQLTALRSHCGAARAAYNWAVRWVLASWSQRKAEETYGICEEDRTAWRSWSLPALRKEFNQVKRTDSRFAGWWEENSKEAYNTGLANASAAFDNYSKSKQGVRKGRRMGRPRFKTKRKARLACRFTTGTIRIDDRRHIVLPRPGRIRVHDDLSGLLAKAEADEMRILSATVRFERGRWFVSFQVEERRPHQPVELPHAWVGMDVGVKTLLVAADSNGQVLQVPNPAFYRQALQRLRKASRKVSRRRRPDQGTGIEPSRRWEKANAERNKIHHRVANLRANLIHQETTRLARRYGTIVAEDLNVRGMARNRRLAKSIADASFGEIRRQLTYKSARHGGHLQAADRFYPSSKTCSGCGVVKAKLPLSCRVFKCDACGLVLDRDHNAAFNLAALATRTPGTGVAGDQDTIPMVSKPRGVQRKTRTARTSRAAGTGKRAADAILPAPRRRKKEAGDRPQTETHPTLR
ncbi:IS607 family element RNA-guided endonuclease TnpB [Nonomuraea sp. NPDC052116]|uniref:IS607 family element RNA-guided endonuclease TnpB n=1 Tax=Nonomuraea sp. NPDC052116 TaxID=3155665 RepID=UPI003420FA6A